MLTERYGSLPVGELFVETAQYSPFPRYEERERWISLPRGIGERWIKQAEAYLDFTWPALKMDGYMNIIRTGNISVFLNAHWERRKALGSMVIAECVEGRGRFMDQIVNGIFCICEETSWMQPLSNTNMHRLKECIPDQEDHVVELAASETAALLIWIGYLLGTRLDAISKRICRRMVKEVRTRVLLPYLEHDDYWWLGFIPGQRVNNWNPWCNANVLMGFLLVEEDPQIREAGIKKVMRSLDAFLDTYSPDGCCDEGPMYWSRSGGSLFDCLELLYTASEERVDLFSEPLVKEIGRYLYRVHIHGAHYVDFADGDATVSIPADVVYGYGRRIGDEHLAMLGASAGYADAHHSDWFPLYRYIRDLFQEAERSLVRDRAPYIRDAWMKDTQVMTAREREGCRLGLFLAAKGGHNLESHNHNDVGSFIVYADGHPVLIDLGTEAYTAKTFSPQRFELWYLQSAYHNLPTVRNVMQRDGRAYAAAHADYRQNDKCADFSVDIVGAYPDDAGINFWRRTFRLFRGKDPGVEVTDDFILKEPAGEIYWSLMTSCEPIKARSGRVILSCSPDRQIELHYDAERLNLETEKIGIADERLKRNWGSAVFRMLFTTKQPQIQGDIRFYLKQA